MKDKTATAGTSMTGASILWECLEREGVKHVFGYPGGAILPAYDALKGSKIHHILVRHEQGAFSVIASYLRVAAQDEKILAYRADDYYWRDLGRPENVAQAARDAEQRLFQL